MMKQRTIGNTWLLALTLLLCLGLALVLTTMVSASEKAAAERALPSLSGASDEWWAAVQARLQNQGYALSMSDTPDWKAIGENDGDQFARAVASAGDVNGDGFADAIVGAHYNSAVGAAYVYHGSAGGLESTPVVTLTGDSYGNDFGYSVAGAGDVNGDGYADVIVGDQYWGTTNRGAAYIYHGSAGGLAATPVLTLTGKSENELFG